MCELTSYLVYSYPQLKENYYFLVERGVVEENIKQNKFKECRSSQRPLTGSWDDACSEKGPSLYKRKIRSDFRLD